MNVTSSYKTQTYGCNCRTKESCPLQNQCLTPKIIYRADVENDTNSDTKFYFGLTETPITEQFGNHTRDFKHKTYCNSTELSKYIWALKETGINTIVTWFIAKIIYSKSKINYCKLRLLQKLHIIDFIDEYRLLNKRNEFISGFKHKIKSLLKNV